MEQRDYILREIEKIGMVIRAIRQKLFGSPDDLAITVDNQAETLREMLLGEAYLDLDELVALDPSATERYLAGLKGFNTENIELLANTLEDIGLGGEAPGSRVLLEKALQLYEICSMRDRTFSFEREAAVRRISEALQK
ncbi:MAG: hypothetical protein R2758_08630 [Bacteroidales bacterium]